MGLPTESPGSPVGVLGLVWAGRVQSEEEASVSLPITLLAGTLEERGLLSELAPQKAEAGHHHLYGGKGEASQAYGLPERLRRLLPSSCKTFPCCFLCPGCEEEEENEEEGSCASEEGTAAPGEGMQLLSKPGSGEPQLARRLSEMEVPVWHSVA